MFALRRFAARGITAPSFSAPLRAQCQQSRLLSIASCTPKRVSPLSSLQRRWASDDAAADAPKATEAVETSWADEVPATTETSEAVETQQEPPVPQEAAADAAGQQKPFRLPERRSVFIANLFYDVSLAQITETFSRFGEIADARLATDNRGLSKGYGWINFKDDEAGVRAVEAMNGSLFEGRVIGVSHSTSTRPVIPTGMRRITARELQERPRSTPSRTLFIGNMSYEMTDSDLNDLFRSVEGVVDVRVAIDRRSGQPRGFAHADFVDVDSATAAFDFLSQKVIYNRRLRIDYSSSSKMIEDDKTYSKSEQPELTSSPQPE